MSLDLSGLDEIINRLRYVKTGDYVLASDHNDLVDAIKKIREILSGISPATLLQLLTQSRGAGLLLTFPSWPDPTDLYVFNNGVFTNKQCYVHIDCSADFAEVDAMWGYIYDSIGTWDNTKLYQSIRIQPFLSYPVELWIGVGQIVSTDNPGLWWYVKDLDLYCVSCGPSAYKEILVGNINDFTDRQNTVVLTMAWYPGEKAEFYVWGNKVGEVTDPACLPTSIDEKGELNPKYSMGHYLHVYFKNPGGWTTVQALDLMNMVMYLEWQQKIT